MKKALLLVIALFAYGSICLAQGAKLSANKMLMAKGQTRQMTINRAPKAPTGATQYWVAANGYFDEWGSFDASQVNPANMQATLTFNGTEVKFENFVDFGWFTLTNAQDIIGQYDAQAKTITIAAKGYDGESPVSAYTQMGTINYYGENLTVCLFAGNFSEEADENGQYALTTVDQLVFDVDDELTTLTPRTGYGCYGFGQYNSGFVAFYKSAIFTLRGEEPCLLVSPEEVMFEGQSVTVGGTVKKTIKLSNAGLTETIYEYETSDNLLMPAVSVAGLDAGETQEIDLYFYPDAVGEYTGWVEFTAENGSKARVDVTANVAEAPDFSPIVKRGDITFSFDENMPFRLDTEKFDYPIAISTNQETTGGSSLIANVVVPEGKTSVLSWKGVRHSVYPQTYVDVLLDGGTVYTNRQDAFNQPLVDYPIDNTIVLGEGTHQVSFSINISMNAYVQGWISEPYEMWVYDMAFDVEDKADNSAYLKTEALDFGNHYVDKLEVQDEGTVLLLNIGTEPLKVTAISTDGAFSGKVDNALAAYGEDLPVTLTFNAQAVGEYTGNVVISTTAGDFTVPCTATVEAIPTDYSPIVIEGDFSFNTSEEYPFLVEEDKAYSSTAYMEDKPSGKVVSWLEAEFVIPENATGILSWIGYNSSEDWFNIMGSLSFNDGTRIIIDGDVTKEFCGEADASSTEFDEEALTFAPGRHKVRFEYEKILSQPKGNDRFDLSALSLIVEGGNSAVSGIDAGKQVVSTEIFTLAGQRVNDVRSGVNIIRYTYSDGTTQVVKALVK